MDEREKLMLEGIKPERHKTAMMILATIKNIKEECEKNRWCENCRFYNEKGKYYNPCSFYVEIGHENPKDWNEYDLTERICK